MSRLNGTPRKVSWRVAGVVSALALAASACGGAASGERTEVELTLGHFMPVQHPMHQRLMKPFAEELAERSNGRIQLTIHPGGALGEPPGQYEAAATGVMDIAFGLQEYTPGRFPLTSAMQLPFLPGSAEQATRVMWELYETVPEFAAEYDDVKVLALWATDVGVLHTGNEPVETLEDLRGLQMRSPGPIPGDILQALGATPVTMPINEVYDALERGVVDGLVTPYSATKSFSLSEVLGHTTRVPCYISPVFLVMNRQAWESLSPADQKLIDELSGKELSQQGARAYDAAARGALEQLEKSGVELHELSETELARWREAADPVIANWIERREAEGLPGREAYQRIVEMTGQR